MPRSARSSAIALTVALLAVCLPPAARLLVGPRGVTVHVRWQAAIDPVARQQREARFALADGRPDDDARTRRYDLTDPSRANIRALVLDPAVADTSALNRSTYAVQPSATRTARRQRIKDGDRVVEAADWSALMLAAVVVLLLVGQAPVTRRLQPARLLSRMILHVRNAAGAASAAMTRACAPWIPELDGRALGAFRLALGCGLLWIAWTTDLNAIAIERQRHLATPDWGFVHAIAASPRACGALVSAMLVGALLFTVGLRTRWAYAGFVVAFFLHALVKLESSRAHDLGLPLITFIGWLTASWGDGLSIDRWRRTRAGRRVATVAPNRMYGFAIWWPGLTLGAALLAAAYAKLDRAGLAWITGGAVKYHFVTDAGIAPFDWGLWVASREWAAVLLSFGAIGVEAAFILNVFARGPGMRLAAGAAGAGLFAGLYLFQGHHWWPWLVLLLAFLPWAWLNRSSREPVGAAIGVAPPTLRMPQLVAVAVLTCTQVFASAARIETEPLLSNFPMYAYTYASPADFDRSMRWSSTHLLEARADGQEVTDVLPKLYDDDRVLLMELAEQRLPPAARLTEDQRSKGALLCERYRRVIGALPTEVTLRMERRGFDWHAGRFSAYTPLPTSPVHLADLCRSS